MPNIEVPKTDLSLGLQPSDRAADSSALAGRRIGQNYNEAGSAIDKAGAQIGSGIAVAGEAVVKYREHQEISKGAVAFAQLQLALTREWNDRAKAAAQNDPNDPSVGPEFHEKILDPSLERFAGTFRTRGGAEWAERRVDALRSHMYQQTAADMSTLAGHAAVVNKTQEVNTLSSTAMENPGGTKKYMDDFKSSVDAMVAASPNLTAVQAAKFREEMTQKGMEAIVRSGVFGAIQKNPEAGLRMAQDSDLAPYISGMEVKQFETYARQQDRMAKSEAREQKRFQQEEAQQRSDDTVIALRKRMGPDAVGPPVTREEINKHADGEPLSPNDTPGVPRLTRRDVEHLVNLQEHYGRPEPAAAKSAETYRATVDQIRSGELKTLGPIWALESQGLLTRADSDRLQKAVGDMRTEAGASLQQEQKRFLAGAKQQIDKSVMGASIYTNGGMEFYRFEVDLERKMEEYRKAGKSPHDLLDPSKPDYMGSPKVLNKYISPLDLQVRDAVMGATGRPPLSSFRR